MHTIGWLLILTAVIIIRGVSKGMGLTEMPSYLGDLMVGAITADQAKVRDVLARTKAAPEATPTSGAVGTGPASIPSAGPVVSNAGLPVNNGTQARLIELGHVLKARGVRVGEGPPPFGPIYPVHASNSYHSRKPKEGGPAGLALDLNYDGKGVTEKAYFDRLADQLVAAGWRVIWWTKGHYDHIHVDVGKAGRVYL